MNRINLVLLWHMHQPQYRDPESGRYVLPWTRLHALKDYWGMVRVLQEAPKFHATFNVVPSLGMQIEEYASGKFDEPWFSLAYKNTDDLTREDKTEILARAFQLNHERLMSRFPRMVELFEWSASLRRGTTWKLTSAPSIVRWCSKTTPCSAPSMPIASIMRTPSIRFGARTRLGSAG